MTVDEIDKHYLTWLNDSNQDNTDSLLKASYELARQQLWNQVDRDDIANDVAMKVVEWLPRLRQETAFSHWILTVIHNRKVDYDRATQRRKIDELIEDTIALYEPTPTFAHKRLREASGENFPLVQDLLRGYDLAETAERHGTTEKAVRQRLFRMRQKAGKIIVN